jgi:hypothetical protein
MSPEMKRGQETHRAAAGQNVKTFVILRVSLSVLLLAAGNAHATPSSTFWTPMTPDFQSYGVFHLGIDNYFVIRQASPSGAFPTDFTAPTVGVLPFKRLQMEVGVDYFANTDHPWLFNAKIGAPENSWFSGQPALAVGIFDAGRKFRTNRADYDVAYGVVGKSLGPVGRFSAGPYVGNHAALVSSSGKPANVGVMVAYDHGFAPKRGGNGAVEYNRLVFAADYASGKNFIGGGGCGFYYYFTKDISLLVGPTFFNDQGINGKWKISAQLDINLPQLFGRGRH